MSRVPRVEVVEASRADAPVLENLLSLYVHDWSEVFGTTPEPDGRYVYARLPLYFEEPGRSALRIHVDGSLAGFALVSSGSVVHEAPEVRDLSEFFVVRGLRRRGIGSRAASAVFRRFPGPWEVRALDRNRGAGLFWARAIAAHTGGAFEEHAWHSDAGSWRVFHFTQPAAGG